MASVWGHLFRVMTFGESHGPAVGCVVEGCVPGVPWDLPALIHFLARRRPGQTPYASQRQEPDAPQVLSGIHNGKTVGSPIAIVVPNTNARSHDYTPWEQTYRPGHGDFTSHAKFGTGPLPGGGRFSARETVGRVAAGAVAQQMVRWLVGPVEVRAWVQRVGPLEAPSVEWPDSSDIENSPLRCPHLPTSSAMEALLSQVAAQGDSLGGLVVCAVRGIPPGWGEPVFDKLEADLAKAMLSIPATRSFEMGSGLQGTHMRGSAHNDAFVPREEGGVATVTNRCGGVLGGISTGMPLAFSVGFKPVSTVFLPQNTVTRTGEPTVLHLGQGRHDPCVVPRAVPIVEAMAWLVLADHALRHRALTGSLGGHRADSLAKGGHHGP